MAKTKSKAKSLSKRAELTLPAGRIAGLMRKNRVAKRVGRAGAVAVAAVTEYILAEVLDLAGNVTTDMKRSTINARAITLAVRNDEELSKLFAKVTFASGGVLPFVHDAVKSKAMLKADADPKA